MRYMQKQKQKKGAKNQSKTSYLLDQHTSPFSSIGFELIKVSELTMLWITCKWSKFGANKLTTQLSWTALKNYASLCYMEDATQRQKFTLNVAFVNSHRSGQHIFLCFSPKYVHQDNQPVTCRNMQERREVQYHIPTSQQFTWPNVSQNLLSFGFSALKTKDCMYASKTNRILLGFIKTCFKIITKNVTSFLLIIV